MHLHSIPVPLVCLTEPLQGSEVRPSVAGATPSAAQGSVDPESEVGAGATEGAQGSALGGVTAGGDARRGQGSVGTTNKEEKPGKRQRGHWEDTSSILSPVDAQGSEFTLEDESPHGSGATVAGAAPQGSALGGEAGEAAPHGSAGPQGPAVDAGAKVGGGEGPAEPDAGAPQGSTTLNSIRDD